MSDAIDEFRVQVYRGTLADRPEAGVAQRVWEVDNPGTDEHGAIYVDDGSQWTLVDRKFKSVSAEEALIKSPFGLAVNAGWDGFANIGEAVDFLEAENLTTLYVPSGDYPTEGDGVFGTGKLNINIRGFTLYGDGYTSRIHSTDGDNVAMRLNAENQTVFNVRLEGEDNNALRLDGAANSVVRSSWFDEPEENTSALRLRDGADNCRIIGCRTTPGDGSFSLRVNTNDNVVIGNTADDGIRDDGTGNIIDNNKIL